ncbi:MAG TPA: hypothetical protein PLL48_14090 [Novosphingobium sp.]|nr:hypothetical protein [Novosphingobium sp.]
MKQRDAPRPAVPGSFFAKLMLPFAVPILATLVLILAGDRWPRAIAPGSGLKLAGLVATGLTAYAAWRIATGGLPDARVRRFAALLCCVTGLMGWPVWSTGPLPSINGAVLTDHRTVVMSLDRLQVTHKSRSRDLYHWAWLSAGADGTRHLSGRYFISGQTHARLSREAPARVEVKLARGLLGGVVVTGLD